VTKRYSAFSSVSHRFKNAFEITVKDALSRFGKYFLEKCDKAFHQRFLKSF
jgi:hypothetical protein